MAGRRAQYRPDKFPDPWLARTIHALAVDQHTVPEIVEQTGATRDVVRGYLHRAGLKVPDGRTANGYRRQAASAPKCNDGAGLRISARSPVQILASDRA